MRLDEQVQQLNEALAKSERRFRAIFEQAPFSIQLLSMDGRTVAVNPAYKKLWSASDEMIEKFILNNHNFLEDKALEESGHLDLIKRGFAGETVKISPFYYDPMTVGLPGRARWAGGTILPLKDKDGEVREVAIIHEDVTDQYELNAERERLYQEAQEAIKLRDEFITIASHEIRTPISSISLQFEVLSHILKDIETPESEQAKKVMSHTRRQLDRLINLVEDLLESSGMKDGARKSHYTSLDLVTLTSSVLDSFSDQLEHFKIPLSFSAPEKAIVCGDQDRLEQVITNLMTNAIRYGNLKPLEVTVTVEERECVLMVRDGGPGIAPEDQERIFNRFERGDASKNLPGLGLGLFINRQIIEHHGGRIFLESVAGKGTSFFVSLPREKQETN